MKFEICEFQDPPVRLESMGSLEPPVNPEMQGAQVMRRLFRPPPMANAAFVLKRKSERPDLQVPQDPLDPLDSLEDQ